MNQVPYMLFLLAYGNFAFQVYIPLATTDKSLQGKDVKIIFIPTPFDMKEGADFLIRKKLDLNSKTSRRGEKVSLTMKYETMEANSISSSIENPTFDLLFSISS